MEGPDIEAGTKLLLGAISEIKNLELTNFVTEALCGPRDVSVNFSLDRGLIRGTAFAEVGHRLFACPTFGVCIVDDVKTELGQAREALLDGDLHVMTRNPFVVSLRLVGEQFAVCKVGSRNHDASWPGSIRGAENIVRGIVRLGGRRSFHSQRGFREHSEKFG